MDHRLTETTGEVTQDTTSPSIYVLDKPPSGFASTASTPCSKSHAIPMAAVTQIRFNTPGRVYYDKKRAEGKTKRKPCGL